MEDQKKQMKKRNQIGAVTKRRISVLPVVFIVTIFVIIMASIFIPIFYP